MKQHISFSGARRRRFLGSPWRAAAVLAVSAWNFPAPPAAAQTTDIPDDSPGVIHLVNGDRLTAALTEYDAAGGKLMLAPGSTLRNAVELDTTALARFERSLSGKRPPPHAWLIKLRNGDFLEGDRLTLDATTVRLRHRDIGDVALPRDAIAVISSAKDVLTIYEGPEPDEEWSFPQGVRRLSGPMLRLKANQPLGRTFPDLPKRIRLDFSVPEWDFQSSVGVFVFSERLASSIGESQSCYFLQLHGPGHVSLLKRSANAMSQVGQASPRSSDIPPSMRISLFADTEKKRFVVMRNEEVVGDWTDTQGAIELGRTISFVSQRDSRIRDIRLSHWNGRLPSEEAPVSPRAAEMVFLQNEDVVSGELQAIGETAALLHTRFGDLEVPLDRIARIEMREASVGDAATGAATIALSDRTELALQVSAIRSGFIQGRHPLAGPMRIPMSIVRRIVWIASATPDNREDSAGGGEEVETE